MLCWDNIWLVYIAVVHTPYIYCTYSELSLGYRIVDEIDKRIDSQYTGATSGT